MATLTPAGGGASVQVVVVAFDMGRDRMATRHAIIGAAAPLVVSTGGLRARAGTIAYRCSSLTAARAVEAVHAGTVTLTAPDQPGMGVTYVADRVHIRTEERLSGGWHWVVSVDAHEVA